MLPGSEECHGSVLGGLLYDRALGQSMRMRMSMSMSTGLLLSVEVLLLCVLTRKIGLGSA
jgi:hypothetical protein